MYKKICSLIVVFFTTVYVLQSVDISIRPAVTCLDKFGNMMVSSKDTVLNKIKDVGNSTQIKYDEVQQQSQITVSNRQHNLDSTDKKIKLAEYDKERLLSVSKKLSSIDQQKINSYIESSTAKELLACLNLLKQRLPNKDYGEIIDLAGKYEKLYGSTIN